MKKTLMAIAMTSGTPFGVIAQGVAHTAPPAGR